LTLFPRGKLHVGNFSMFVFHEQNSVSDFVTKPRLANSFPRFHLMTRMAATRCKSIRATLSPRIIRGDKVLLADIQLFTAVRVGEKLMFKAHSKPLPGNKNDLLHASLKNLCRRLTPAGCSPAPYNLEAVFTNRSYMVPSASQPVAVQRCARKGTDCAAISVNTL